MTILSQELLFSEDQVVTATAFADNVIDLGEAGTPQRKTIPVDQDIGKGCPVCMIANISEGFADIDSLEVEVVVADDDTLATNLKVVGRSPIYDIADLAQPRLLEVPAYIPEGTNQRYLGLRYVVAGGPGTAGKLFAGISMGRQTSV